MDAHHHNTSELALARVIRFSCGAAALFVALLPALLH